MKNILIISTSERVGGAAIAANRLMRALNRLPDVRCSMLTRKKKFPAFYFERFVIWMHNRFKKKGLFDVSIANCGENIMRTKAFQEADVVHLHWINQGFLSLAELRRIFASGKLVVWTMHDMWAFTGICHYADGCGKYHTACNGCEQLLNPSKKDLSARYYGKKKVLYENAPVTFVGCSRWIAGMAEKSGLLTGHEIINIPNAIDTDVFRPFEKAEIRKKLHLPEDKKLILFCSMKTSDVRKGMSYLLEACQNLAKDDFAVIILGGKAENYKNMLPVKAYCLDYVDDEKAMAEIYNAADVFVTPSLQDNLPNTVMEAMACGTPCVGFDIGGIPEMIDHRKNGYVAEYRNAKDLAEGIKWVADNAETGNLGRNARQKVMENYAENVVAKRYMDVYEACGKENL